MGGHDDADVSYVVNKQRQDEELKNKLNESHHWCDQDASGNNAKWVKEGRNQLRKVAETQQDQDLNCNISQNGNREDFPDQTTARDGRRGSGERAKSPKRATTAGLSRDSKDILNDPLLIDALESTQEKDKEREGDGGEKEGPADEDGTPGDAGGEAEPRGHEESQKEGGVVGRNACLLFSNLNGTPSEEESFWPALSQDTTAASSPNDSRGKLQPAPRPRGRRIQIAVKCCAELPAGGSVTVIATVTAP